MHSSKPLLSPCCSPRWNTSPTQQSVFVAEVHEEYLLMWMNSRSQSPQLYITYVVWGGFVTASASFSHFSACVRLRHVFFNSAPILHCIPAPMLCDVKAHCLIRWLTIASPFRLLHCSVFGVCVLYFRVSHHLVLP